MPLPLALAAPAAIAGLAYLNAKTSLGNDARVLGAYGKAIFKMNRKAALDRLNVFYVLEEYAQNPKIANSVFFVFEGQQWTYKEFYEIILRVGTWLKTTYNIMPNDIIAMDFGNSEKFLHVWFGLWSIGARPAFINYNLTGKPLIHCIKVSTAKLAIIDPRFESNITEEARSELSDVNIVIYTPELEAAAVGTAPVRQPDSHRSAEKPSDMAMLIYTSGTTGLPKPAIVAWGKPVGGALIAASFIGFKQQDIYYTCMPLYHSSASILGVCAALHTGATIVIGRKFSTKTFWQEVRASNATIIQYVGETCRYLLSAPPQLDENGVDLDKQNKVRVAFGNGLRPDVWNKFKERFGIEAIAEFYSATEGAIGLWNYSRNDFSRGAIGRMGSIGSVVSSRSTAIVDLDWETETPRRDPVTGLCSPVPRGEPGEFLAKLDAADVEKNFQGYFNNEKATSTKVLRNVLVKGDAYFRSGDMIRWDEEGRFYFSDRIGDTFRWKSENVSTNEVSESLGGHAAVEEANVYGVELPHHDGRAGCVALVLSEPASEQLMKSLADHVHRELPKFAIPLFLRVTKEMQMTGTNKQQKHVVRAQGVNPAKVDNDEMWWLKNGTYVRFNGKDWQELRGGSVKL